MAIYRVQAPDGGIIRMEAPDNATPEQLSQAVHAYAQAAQLPSTAEPQSTSLIDQAKAIPGAIKEAFTGDQRRTAQTDALPDWASMPELNSLSMASAKTGLGTMLSNPAETAQIIKANFPNVDVSQDEKGNYLLRSSIDGKQYAIKPGFQMSDVPRAVGGMLAFTPAGRSESILGAGLTSASTQAGIEATQAATGGNFNTGDIATAGVVGAAVPAVANAVRAAAEPAGQLLNRVRGVPDPAAEIKGSLEGAAPTAGTAAAAPADATAAMEAPDLAQTARSAAEGGIGSNRAKKILAEQAAPDPKVVQAADRLGIQDYLQPDHVTTNQAYRELAQAAKSIPGSEGRAAELQGLEQVAKRADSLINEIGGTEDFSTLDANVKKTLQAAHDELKNKAGQLYTQVRDAIPAKSEAPAPTVLSMIKQRADELGGMQNISPMEKMVYRKLGSNTPTYALLDDVRRDLTAAKYSRQGPFKDSDDRLITMLEGALRQDQQAAAERYGMGDTWDLAQKTSATYKGIQDDLSAIFGKNLDGTLVGSLSGAVRALPAGDTSKFLRLLKAIPDGMRQEVVASGLNTALGKTAKNGSLNFRTYSDWYEGLLRNKQAYTALMANLPQSARKQLSDLYRVSKAISLASKERITTGRINSITDQLKPVDSLVGRLYDVAKRGAVGAAAGTVVTPVLGPGVGAAVASALTSAPKSSTIKAVDELISSPEFVNMAKNAGTPGEKAARLRLVYSKPFTKYVRAVGQPRELSNRERWVLQSMQAENNQQR